MKKMIILLCGIMSQVFAQQHVFVKPTTAEQLYNTEITPETPQSPDSLSDLWFAINNDFTDLALQLIAHKTDIHQKNADGLTPIEYALKYKKHALLQALIAAENEKDLKQKKDAEETLHQIIKKPKFNKPIFTDLNAPRH